jgi:hypothetical protein
MEICRLFEKRDDAIDSGKFHDAIDRSIAQSACHRTEGEASSNLGPEPGTPSPLVLAQPGSRQLIVSERGAKDLGGNTAAE